MILWSWFYICRSLIDPNTANLTIQRYIDFMPPKITAKKVSSKTIRPSSSNRLNSLKANSEARFLAPGSVAVFGVLLFFAFVIAQIIFINWWASSPFMLYIDVFNGDADGVCALHQLRLHNPQESRLVTGVKRDTLLLKRIIFSAR